MYDAASLRQQLEQVWANFILQQTKTRRERANIYKTKKIMNRAHGVSAYYTMEFPVEYLAFSHVPSEVVDAKPFEWMLEKPELLGVWGATAEVMGEVEPEKEEVQPEVEVMEEEDFFAQHFTSSLSDTMSSLRNGQ